MRGGDDVNIIVKLNNVESFLLLMPDDLRLRIAGHLTFDCRGAVQRIRELFVVVVQIDDRLESNLHLKSALRRLHVVAVAVDRVAGDRGNLPLHVGDRVG